MYNRTIFFFISILLVWGCKTPPSQPAFYFWKTQYHLSDYEKSFIHNQDVKHIYIRCFDIDVYHNRPMPQGVLMWQESPLQNIQYVPVIYIQNQVFETIDSGAVDSLAMNTIKLSKAIMAAQHLPFDTLQIDCDWTTSTRDKYFKYITALKRQQMIISSTLRLYQYKYPQKTGIPPVDFCTLMCYNMGNLKTADANNSILNQSDLEAYTKNVASYPIPLNTALPIFQWTLVYKGNQFKGILYHAPDTHNNHWIQKDEIKYICTNDYYDSTARYYFSRNDFIRIEALNNKELQQAKAYIQNTIKNSTNEILYFDLDSSHLQHYSAVVAY